MTAGAVTLATLQRDDGGDGRGHAAQEAADDGDEQPQTKALLAGSAAEIGAPVIEKRHHGAAAGSAAANPVETAAPLPAAAGGGRPGPVTTVATKEAVPRQGHSGGVHAGSARPSASASASTHPDAGASAGSASPDGGARAGQKIALAKGDPNALSEDTRSDFVRVSRFASAGGASLQGRVVDADSGRPVIGAAVEAVYAEKFMEGRTDSSGAFQMAGMLPGTRVRIWVGGKHDPFVAERIDVGVPAEGQVADAGVIRLVRGDELASRLDGWVGLFVARRGGRVLVSAVSPWLSADRAGVQVGDQLVSIDGRDVAGFGPRAVAFLLRGPPKSSVAIVVERDGTRRKLSLERVLR